jgi:hypothetical protein
MRITNVTVNHTERNYFNDYDEVRTDRITEVTLVKVLKTIDKLVRRYRSSGRTDCMFVTNDDGTGWRLVYDFDPELFDKGITKKYLRLRHYINMSADSWDTEENVSVAYAKQAISGKER